MFLQPCWYLSLEWKSVTTIKKSSCINISWVLKHHTDKYRYLFDPYFPPHQAVVCSSPVTCLHSMSVSLQHSSKCSPVMLKSLKIRLCCFGSDQYSPHTPTVEAPSVSLNWHLRLSFECHSDSGWGLFTLSTPQRRLSPLVCMSSTRWVFFFSDTQTSLQCILRYLFKGLWSAAVNNFSVG